LSARDTADAKDRSSSITSPKDQFHDYGLVPLCHEHHVGGAGLHGMGSKNFLRIYRPPGDSEYGLLIWTIEDVAQVRQT
jgi:hypothetical protein